VQLREVYVFIRQRLETKERIQIYVDAFVRRMAENCEGVKCIIDQDIGNPNYQSWLPGADKVET